VGSVSSVAGVAGAGLLSFLSPCILPLVPSYLCFLAGISLDQMASAESSPGARPQRRVIAQAVAFVLGFSTIFIALGASASLIGKLVTAHFAMLGVVAGLMLVVLGLHFLGLFRLGFLYRDVRFNAVRAPVGLLGAYAIGLAFAFGWTPCVGPVLASILMIAGTEESGWRGALLLGVYALGLGIPFLAAALFVGSFMKMFSWLRVYIRYVEKVIGAGLIATGILFLTGGMPSMGNLLLETFPALGSIG
jgi:cytochrome c-type biogenesis protein